MERPLVSPRRRAREIARMSYILDALKKAEQKRQLTARIPTLGTVHRAPEAPRSRPWPWAWMLTAAVLVNVGVLAWVLYPNVSNDNAPGQAPQSPQSPSGPVAAVAPTAPTTVPQKPATAPG